MSVAKNYGGKIPLDKTNALAFAGAIFIEILKSLYKNSKIVSLL
ncbi:hypothetical protein ST089_11920 [Streptococcus agalactiae]|nr:hypothetical protein SAG0049_10850 [Streptococcus agalactiae CCUG 91]